MQRCPGCLNEVSARSRFCDRCGTELTTASTAPTQDIGSGEALSPGSTERFLPGQVLAKRYRLIAEIGRGGMGRVYRADDLRLGQSVALKFLTEELDQSPDRLARLLGEVRLAREVSHPNVCRVYDVVETEGEVFVAMEFIDGEDLASLLRRIGRLPREKALQIARQLCAGLAAVHDRGLIHRDLKPGNVMIDGRGRVRLADFGLAAIAGQLAPADARAGTPAYMAPEQLAGGEISQRTDLYALGVALYELFTGRLPFAASTSNQLARLQREARPAPPSSHVEGVDPLVERVILDCLERDPAARPASALEVSARLPGGDPLAEALAAGEVPSPELVAEAGGSGLLRRSVATACLLGTALLLAGGAWLSNELTRTSGAFPEQRPQVLAHLATELARAHGYERPHRGRSIGFSFKAEHPASEPSARGGLTFWLRLSPRPLFPTLALEPDTFAWQQGVTLRNPPQDHPGMVTVRLDREGRLIEMMGIPERAAAEGSTAARPDWPGLFAAAGLEIDRFRSVQPGVVPAHFADRRAAWSGPHPTDPSRELRVEAAALGSTPVLFRVAEALAPPRVLDPGSPSLALFQVLWWIVLIASVVFGWRNLRRGRTDRRGAFAIALFTLAIAVAMRLLAGTHPPNPAAEPFLAVTLAIGLQSAVRYWFLYTAIEPYARRFWPQSLISWTRLLQGRFRDPMVGRDLLVGGLAGAAGACFLWLSWLLGEEPRTLQQILASQAEALIGINRLAASLLSDVLGTLFAALFFFLVFVLLRLLVQRSWLAAALLLLLILTVSGRLPGLPGQVPLALLALASWVLAVVMLIRFGFLAAATTGLVHNLLAGHPAALDLDRWYAAPSLVPLLLVLCLSLYGFWRAGGVGLKLSLPA